MEQSEWYNFCCRLYDPSARKLYVIKRFFFAGRGISGFAIVVISALLPIIFIAFPLFFLEWSIFTKIAIVLGYVLIAPIICWADAEDYGIFGALGFEW